MGRNLGKRFQIREATSATGVETIRKVTQNERFGEKCLLKKDFWQNVFFRSIHNWKVIEDFGEIGFKFRQKM
jgi:hypothetical protein